MIMKGNDLLAAKGENMAYESPRCIEIVLNNEGFLCESGSTEIVDEIDGEWDVKGLKML